MSLATGDSPEKAIQDALNMVRKSGASQHN